MDDKNIYIVGEGGKAALGEQLAQLTQVAEKMGKEILFVDSEDDIPALDLPEIAHDVALLPDIQDMFADMEAMLLTPNEPPPSLPAGWSIPEPRPMLPLTPKEKRRAKAKRKAARKARRKNR